MKSKHKIYNRTHTEENQLKETPNPSTSRPLGINHIDIDKDSNKDDYKDKDKDKGEEIEILKNIEDDKDQDYKAEQEFKTAARELEKNLLFEKKNISIFKLYSHLSNKFDIFLMMIGIIGSIGSGCAGPLMAYLTGDTISKMTTTSSGRPTDKPSFFDDLENTVETMMIRFLSIGAGMFLGYFIMNSMWTLVALRQMQYLKEKYFAIILCQEQGWFDSNNAFEFATKVQAQLEQIELAVGENFGQILQLMAQLISGLTIAFTSSWKLTLLMLCVLPLIMIDVMLLVTSLKKGLILSRKTYEKAGGIAEEMLYNIKTVASFANFEYETARYNKYIEEVNRLDRITGLKLGACIGFLILLTNLTFVIALVYARELIAGKGINENTGERYTSGDVMTVMFATLLAIMSIGQIGPHIKTIQEGCVASSDYFTLYERIPQIDTSKSIMQPLRDTIKGRIEFKNIDFVYPSDISNRKILDDINIVIEPGQKVALVGESGCGKSTIVNLIERLYDPIRGDVFVDGINIKQYGIAYLRSLIGYVQQEPVLFNKSIKDNLIFGREEYLKTIGGDVDKLINDACEEAYALEFINQNPEKFDYTVGIKGSKLSGGQKQRIAIARAILCKPKILILDEATSALDNKSEKEVQQALDRISQNNITTVIIAHRLSTIKNADMIFAIKDGKVQEKGTHKELLEKQGYYAGLVKSQLAEDALGSKEDNLQLTKKIASMANNRMTKKLSSKVEAYEQLEQIEKNKTIPVKRMRIFKMLKNHKCDLFLATIGSAVQGGLNPVNGLLLAKAINALSSPLDKTIMDDGLLFALLFLVIAVLNGVFTFLKIWKFQCIGSELTTLMRRTVISKYLKLHVGYFDRTENSPGALLTQLTIDTTQLNSLVLELVGDVVNVLFNLITGIVLALIFDWRLGLIGICFIPFMGISYMLRSHGRKSGRESDKQINIEAGSILSETVVNTKTIYSFNFQKTAVAMYIGLLEESKKQFTKDSFISGFLLGLGIFAQYCLSATVFKVAVGYIKDDSLTFEDMIMCLNVLVTSAQGIGSGLQNIGNFKKASNSFKSLFTIIDTESEIDVTAEGNAKKRSANEIQGKIEFRNVSFAYPTRKDQLVLRNVSFVIQPGQSSALVGYSGCGKSTIIQLLERFYDPDEGEILIDDVNIKEYNLISLRKRIGLVSQEPILFKRSVYQNILYGDLSANREEVFNASRRACITKFFTKTDSGTKVDPVSGGEKQRLAIGRAFLKNPKLLLLDEATSALDKESEKEVQKSIYELQKQRTSVTIAHRLSTIENSDIIFVLEAGRIVEQGTHKELLNLQKKYYMLHKYTHSS